VSRSRTLAVRLSDEEFEWLRRKGHWAGVGRAELVRDHILDLVAEEGYLRPPDDEPQDFGFEKEMMQFVVRVQKERD